MRDTMQTYLEQYDVTAMSPDAVLNEYDLDFSDCKAVLVREDVLYGDDMVVTYNWRDADDFDEETFSDEGYAVVFIGLTKNDGFYIQYIDRDGEVGYLDPKCRFSEDMRDKNNDGNRFIDDCIQWVRETLEEPLIDNWKPYDPWDYC